MTNAKTLALASSIPTAIQPLDDFLDPKRARVAVAEKIELEDEPYRFGFNRIDFKFLLDLRAGFSASIGL